VHQGVLCEGRAVHHTRPLNSQRTVATPLASTDETAQPACVSVQIDTLRGRWGVARSASFPRRKEAHHRTFSAAKPSSRNEATSTQSSLSFCSMTSQGASPPPMRCAPALPTGELVRMRHRKSQERGKDTSHESHTESETAARVSALEI